MYNLFYCLSVVGFVFGGLLLLLIFFILNSLHSTVYMKNKNCIDHVLSLTYTSTVYLFCFPKYMYTAFAFEVRKNRFCWVLIYQTNCIYLYYNIIYIHYICSDYFNRHSHAHLLACTLTVILLLLYQTCFAFVCIVHIMCIWFCINKYALFAQFL